MSFEIDGVEEPRENVLWLYLPVLEEGGSEAAEESPEPEAEAEVEAGKQAHSFLWYDTGLSCDHAIQLGKQGHIVHYFIEYRTRYPKVEDWLPCYGFKEVRKVFDWGEVLDAVETIVFVDVGFGSLADVLRRKGYAVFGASAKGEQLEIDRIYMLREFEKLGIKVPKHVFVHGADNLLKAVQGEKFVKLNIFRGNFETFFPRTNMELRGELEHAGFGPVANEVDFIVTDKVEGVEIGVDTFFNGREFLRPINEGNEVKGTGAQFNRWVESSVWDTVLEKLEPWLREAGYRGALSLEGIFDGSDIYVIDVTARLFFPGSSVYPACLENYADVIHAVARGEDVKPRFSHKYYSLATASRGSADRWTRVRFPQELAWKKVFIPRGAVFINGEYWCCPGDPIVATVVGVGNTFDESAAELEKLAEQVEGREVEAGISGLFKYRKEYLTKLREFGITW
jgi:phosphoribosylamine-glycine ligase